MSGGIWDAEDFAEARQQFTTKLIEQTRMEEPVETPPEGELDVVAYPGPLGDMAAYVTPDLGDGQRRPAIIWLFGGFGSGIDANAWYPGEASNDQSAVQYRQEGMVMMYPSLRGGNENPGYNESFYGEVDDVIAAAKWLKTLDYVDADRVYLGGHSTGGTLALLVAEACDEFRGVVSFGPTGDVRGYGPDSLAFDFDNEDEATMRAPVCWLHCIKNPTYVIEGDSGRSNADAVREMKRATDNPRVHFHLIEGHDHFSTLAPLNRVIAKQMMADKGETFELSLGD